MIVIIIFTLQLQPQRFIQEIVFPYLTVFIDKFIYE